MPTHSIFLKKLLIFTLLFGYICYSKIAYAQELPPETPEAKTQSDADSILKTLPDEKIEKISVSRRIFILTNNAESFNKGDFISIIFDSQLAIRALVGKIKDKKAGIKILKIYNPDIWNKIKAGESVKVLRGDDDQFKNLGQKGDKTEVVESKIQSEEDLFNKTTLEGDEDINLEVNSKRNIKPDNIVSVTYGQIEGVDTDGTSQRYGQPGIQWNYQFLDNVWGEVSIGQNIVKDFPYVGLDTKLTNLTLKFKYTFSLPFNSFAKPYLGYQMIDPESPGAGVDVNGSSGRTAAELANEVALVEQMKKSTIIFGATLLKRLVPGWFARADIGTDIISIGLGLEF